MISLSQGGFTWDPIFRQYVSNTTLSINFFSLQNKVLVVEIGNEKKSYLTIGVWIKSVNCKNCGPVGCVGWNPSGENFLDKLWLVVVDVKNVYPDLEEGVVWRVKGHPWPQVRKTRRREETLATVGGADYQRVTAIDLIWSHSFFGLFFSNKAKRFAKHTAVLCWFCFS